MASGVVTCNTKFGMNTLHSNFLAVMQEVWRKHNPTDTNELDITFRIEPDHSNTINVQIGTIEVMTDPKATAIDLQKDLADFIHRLRGWRYFVDVTVVAAGNTAATSIDQSAYRK